MYPIISILLTKYSYTLNINLYIENVLRNILMTILIISTSINFIHSGSCKKKDTNNRSRSSSTDTSTCKNRPKSRKL